MKDGHGKCGLQDYIYSHETRRGNLFSNMAEEVKEREWVVNCSGRLVVGLMEKVVVVICRDMGVVVMEMEVVGICKCKEVVVMEKVVVVTCRCMKEVEMEMVVVGIYRHKEEEVMEMVVVVIC